MIEMIEVRYRYFIDHANDIGKSDGIDFAHYEVWREEKPSARHRGNTLAEAVGRFAIHEARNIGIRLSEDIAGMTD